MKFLVVMVDDERAAIEVLKSEEVGKHLFVIFQGADIATTYIMSRWQFNVVPPDKTTSEDGIYTYKFSKTVFEIVSVVGRYSGDFIEQRRYVLQSRKQFPVEV